MARIRSLKPSVWTDERFIDLTRDARLLFLGMISHADDDGRLVGSGAALIGAIFPHDDVSVRLVEKWRDELVAVGLVLVYTAGRGTYVALPGWSKHQRIQKRMASTLPPPPQSRTESRTGSRTDAETEAEREYATGSSSGSGTEVEGEVEGEVEVDAATSPGPERVAPRIVTRAAS